MYSRLTIKRISSEIREKKFGTSKVCYISKFGIPRAVGGFCDFSGGGGSFDIIL